MPIHRKGSGWQWGNHGKVYKTREGAIKQAQAAHANGYTEPATKRIRKKNKKTPTSK